MGSGGTHSPPPPCWLPTHLPRSPIFKEFLHICAYAFVYVYAYVRMNVCAHTHPVYSQMKNKAWKKSNLNQLTGCPSRGDCAFACDADHTHMDTLARQPLGTPGSNTPQPADGPRPSAPRSPATWLPRQPRSSGHPVANPYARRGHAAWRRGKALWRSTARVWPSASFASLIGNSPFAFGRAPREGR